MDESEYCILWNNYHEALVSTLCGLQREGDMADVTMVCSDGSRVRAHQLILVACSSFLKDFLKENPSKHPIVLMPMEIQYPELKAMVEFMYTGQVCISQERLQSFMRGARYLRIRGVEETADDNYREAFPTSSGVTNRQEEVSVSDASILLASRDMAVSATTTITEEVAENLPVKEHSYTQWTECVRCHSRNLLPYQESPSSKYLCAVCSTPGNSEGKESDHNKKKKAKRKINLSNIVTEQKEEETIQDARLKKKIKVEPEERIELEERPEKNEDEIQHVIYDTTDIKRSLTVMTSVRPHPSGLTTVKKLKLSGGAEANQSRELYDPLKVKNEQQGLNATVFKVLGIFGVTGRKKRYSVTEAELLRRQGPPEHFSNNAMTTYLRFPRTHDALPERFRTPSQRKTTLSCFTNIVEGEAADLAQDFQRFLFSSDLMELLCVGVDDMTNIREVLDHLLDNLAHVDWTNKFNLLTHGAGLLIVRAVLLYVRSLAQ